MRIRKGFKIIAIIILVFGVSFFGLKLFLRQDRIRCAIEYGRLADIPENANKIKVKTRGNIFSRTFYLSFQTTENDINTWIKNSPDLVKGSWINPNKERLIKIRDNDTGKIKTIDLNDQKSGYYWPSWFRFDEIVKGEYYDIPMDDDHFHGKVWIDKKRNIVYIKTSYS